MLHAAAPLVLKPRPRDDVSAALRELHWLPVAQPIDYKLCLLVHKSSRGQAPEYISNMLKPAANDPSLTTLSAAANGNYVVPRTNRRFGDRAFFVATPKAWNRLPTDPNGRFQTSLKTWFSKGPTTNIETTIITITLSMFLLLSLSSSLSLSSLSLLSSPFDIMRHRSLHIL